MVSNKEKELLKKFEQKRKPKKNLLKDYVLLTDKNYKDGDKN